MSGQKQLSELSKEYTEALDKNAFDELDAVGHEISKLVHRRLRRIRHGGNSAAALNRLLSELPPDYNDNVVVSILNRLDNMTTAQRVGEV